ncbi:MAG: tRNA adenosine(34) deaminase TadA [Raoultibacter sp.]
MRPMNDEDYMQMALFQARLAAQIDEVPIGAVVVKDGEVIATAHNRREIDRDPAGHAEFLAMKAAARAVDAWRLSGCTVYVTLEPCIMCAGLMHQARIDRCVFGATDPKAGALGTLYAINADERLNHTFDVTSGVLQEACSTLLSDFFKRKRKK